MRTRIAAGLVVTLSLVVIAAPAGAQAPAPGHAHPSPPAAAQPQSPAAPSDPGMMGRHGQMHGAGGGMSGMMGGMMGQHDHMHGGGPGIAGGMRGGIGCPMMGGMLGPLPPTSDARAYGRALALRGEILKAIGEVMMKHGAALEQPK